MNFTPFIEACLSDTNSAIWWPGLIISIVHDLDNYDLLLNGYTTSSIISNGAIPSVATRQIPGFSTIKLEFLCEAHAGLFIEQGVRQVDIEIFNSLDLVDRLESALNLIRVVPPLLDIVATLARSIHIIKSEPGFDISFTDPALPFSIFLSIPSENTYSDLRLAESIIHESMHLQLSIIEKKICLVENDLSKHFSPWKKMLRPVSGIMHALYVFTAVKQWLDIIAKSSEGVEYARQRTTEIREEISLLDIESCYESLSDFGRILFDTMLFSLKG